MKLKALLLLTGSVLALPLASARGGLIFTNLHRFGVDFDGEGEFPRTALIQAADGNFYGTTHYGVSLRGNVFKMTPDGELTTLYSFTGGSDGQYPDSTLVQGTNGDLYGLTYNGGEFGQGTIYRLTTNGALTTLVSFDGANGLPSGAVTIPPLIQHTSGDFFGVTTRGGAHGFGTVFKMTADGTLTTLRSFNVTNGQVPYGPLLEGTNGILYGTTETTVFTMTPDGILNTLATFNGTNGSTAFGGLVRGNDGNLYGVTRFGGYGNGSVYRVTPGGELKMVAWLDPTNGAYPPDGLVLAKDGNFYGTTELGGLKDLGTIFRVTPDGVVTTVVSFGALDARFAVVPVAGLIQGTDGNLYGTTSHSRGTVFRLSLPFPPVFQSVTANGNTLNFTWSSVAGQTYQLQSNPDVNSTNWTNLGDAVVATNGSMSAFDAIGPDPKKFYRAILLP